MWWWLLGWVGLVNRIYKKDARMWVSEVYFFFPAAFFAGAFLAGAAFFFVGEAFFVAFAGDFLAEAGAAFLAGDFLVGEGFAFAGDFLAGELDLAGELVGAAVSVFAGEAGAFVAVAFFTGDFLDGEAFFGVAFLGEAAFFGDAGLFAGAAFFETPADFLATAFAGAFLALPLATWADFAILSVGFVIVFWLIDLICKFVIKNIDNRF